MFSARSAFCEVFVHGFSLFKHQNLIVLKASQKKILKYEEDAKMGKAFTTFGVELELSLACFMPWIFIRHMLKDFPICIQWSILNPNLIF